MPTIAEQWFEQGRQEGRLEGREEGREATLTLLRRFLAMRFGTELDQFDPVLSRFDLPTLTRLSDAAFETKTLAEFEATLAKLADRPSDTGSDKSTING